MSWMGIDPGKSGAVVVLSGEICHWCSNDVTEHELNDFVREWSIVYGVIEQVGAMPKQGVSSTFKFGTSYGFLRGLLVANGIPFEAVTPRKWQREMGCLTGGDKNITKSAAQRLLPKEKITHRNADAVLLAEYAKRTWNLRNA